MNIQCAYERLQQSGLPPLPSLLRFEEREIEEFLSFMRQLSQGTIFPTRDSERAAAFGLSAREEARELTMAVFSYEDAVERAQGRLSGAIQAGVVQDVRQGRGRTAQLRFQLLCTQAMIRVRERDEFYWADDLWVKVSIEAIERLSAGVILSCLMVEGMRSVGVPLLGTRMELVRSRPDWYNLARERKHLSRRLPRSAKASRWSKVDLELPRFWRVLKRGS